MSHQEPKTATDALERSHAACFVCGMNQGTGLQVHFETDPDGTATAVWQPSPRFQSYPDRVHGGIIAALVDSAMLHALFANGVAGVTAELTIRYLRGVNLEEPLQITGRNESIRCGVYCCSARIRQGGSLAVRASAKFMVMPGTAI